MHARIHSSRNSWRLEREFLKSDGTTDLSNGSSAVDTRPTCYATRALNEPIIV